MFFSDAIFFPDSPCRFILIKMTAINNVLFKILSKNDAQKLSVTTIDSPNFNCNQYGVAGIGSVCDPKLGTTSTKTLCSYCNNGPYANQRECFLTYIKRANNKYQL